MTIKLNLSTLLLALGGVGVFAPDLRFISNWLLHFHVSWVQYVAHIIGFVAAACGVIPLAVPKARKFLAFIKLATAAGEIVPHPEGSPGATPTSPAPTTPSPKRDAGFVGVRQLVLLMVVSSLALGGVWASRSWADTTQPVAHKEVATTPSPAPTQTSVPSPTVAPYKSAYGACWGTVCLAPAFALQAFQYNLATGDMLGGVAFSGGYGVVWHTKIDLGAAVYGGLALDQKKPAQAQVSLMFNVANYVAFGPGFVMIGQPSGPAVFQGTFSVAANWIPGLSIITE